jgi:hypothetical protein
VIQDGPESTRYKNTREYPTRVPFSRIHTSPRPRLQTRMIVPISDAADREYDYIICGEPQWASVCAGTI